MCRVDDRQGHHGFLGRSEHSEWRPGSSSIVFLHAVTVVVEHLARVSPTSCGLQVRILSRAFRCGCSSHIISKWAKDIFITTISVSSTRTTRTRTVPLLLLLLE